MGKLLKIFFVMFLCLFLSSCIHMQVNDRYKYYSGKYYDPFKDCSYTESIDNYLDLDELLKKYDFVDVSFFPEKSKLSDFEKVEYQYYFEWLDNLQCEICLYAEGKGVSNYFNEYVLTSENLLDSERVQAGNYEIYFFGGGYRKSGEYNYEHIAAALFDEANEKMIFIMKYRYMKMNEDHVSLFDTLIGKEQE